MLIGTGTFTQDTLAGQVAVISGAGRGIGFETARALVWLGAKVVLAEIDRQTGQDARRKLEAEFGSGKALFVQTDVGDEKNIKSLKRDALKAFGRVDIVINNATVTPMGAVKDLSIRAWDISYGVNLRGPVMLAQAFLPEMIERGSGVFVCVSSVGQAYMGAYECFKAAQVHLGETLDAELEDSGVYAFTIGPGLVRTPGAQDGIAVLAPLYGKTEQEFYAMSEAHIISVEAAGAGFAAAVVLAEQFHGQEISSKQALFSAGISLAGDDGPAAADAVATETADAAQFSPQQYTDALELCKKVLQTVRDQAASWQARPLFERQWMLRDFRKNAGLPVETWLEVLDQLDQALAAQDANAARALNAPLDKLAGFYSHMQKLAAGYVKDPVQREEQAHIIDAWEADVKALAGMVTGNS